MRPRHLFFWSLIPLALAACGKKGADTTSPPALNNIASLPAITDPAKGAKPASRSPFPDFTGVDWLRDTTNAQISLSAWDQGPTGGWSATYSRAMCEAGLVLKDNLYVAATADGLKCISGNVDGFTYGTGNSQTFNFRYGAAGTTLANAPDNIFKLTVTSGSTTTSKVLKVNAVKDSTGAINLFRAYVCTDVGGTQVSYTDFSNNGGTALVRSIVAGSKTFAGHNFILGVFAEASGTLGSDGTWLTKTLRTATDVPTPSYDVYDSLVEITQWLGLARLYAWAIGTCTHSSRAVHNFQVQTAAYMQVHSTDNSYGLSTLGVANGSAKWTGSWDGATVNNGAMSSWDGNGNRVTPASSGGEYTDANALTLPAFPASTAMTIKLDGTALSYPTDGGITPPDAGHTLANFTWNCSTGITGGTVPEVVASAASTQISAIQKANIDACNTKYTFGNNTGFDYVDCHAAAAN